MGSENLAEILAKMDKCYKNESDYRKKLSEIHTQYEKLNNTQERLKLQNKIQEMILKEPFLLKEIPVATRIKDVSFYDCAIKGTLKSLANPTEKDFKEVISLCESDVEYCKSLGMDKFFTTEIENYLEYLKSFKDIKLSQSNN
ncbi:MAG: hypothetical protein LBM93_11745 [Oscillospiraceae bacterium]|jgi:hypothetical protein|nr:hypothetical protein [Oscillospiraceae bacterium]